MAKSNLERVYENGYRAGYNRAAANANRELLWHAWRAEFFGKMLQRAVDDLHEAQQALASLQAAKGAGR